MIILAWTPRSIQTKQKESWSSKSKSGFYYIYFLVFYRLEEMITPYIWKNILLHLPCLLTGIQLTEIDVNIHTTRTRLKHDGVIECCLLLLQLKKSYWIPQFLVQVSFFKLSRWIYQTSSNFVPKKSRRIIFKIKFDSSIHWIVTCTQ